MHAKIGTRLKLIRKKSGLSRRKVGDLVGVSLQQIQKYEHGVNRISALRLYHFSKIFNVPISYFFDADKDFLSMRFTKDDVAELWERLPNECAKTNIFWLLKSFDTN